MIDGKMIIDTHIHFFMDAIAQKAAAKLKATAQIPCYTDFTEADTRRKLKEWGIDFGLLLPIATKPGQQRKINDWAALLQGGSILCFGTVHPAAQDALTELEYIKALGLRGVKMHPDYQNFFFDDESAFPLYEKMAELGLPLALHAGFDPVSPEVAHATPAMIRDVKRVVPGLRIMAAHMGGHAMYDDVEKYIVGENVYIDISMTPGSCPQEQFERIIKNHGAEKVLFASDCPWTEPRQELVMLEKVELTGVEMERILYRNAAELLNVDINSGE